MKVCEICSDPISTKDGNNLCKCCGEHQANGTIERRKKEIESQRLATEQALCDLGLVKVKGALGGVYWE